MDKAKFMKYMSIVRDLEGSIYIHEKTIANLNYNYNKASQRLKRNDYEKYYEHGYNSNDIPPMDLKDGIAYGAKYACAFILGLLPVELLLCVLFSSILPLILFIIIIITVCMIIGKNRYYTYYRGSDEWNRIEEINKKIAKRNDTLKSKDSQQIKLIPQQIKLMKDNLDKLSDLLYEYYSVGILHKDYRNLVAVCSIYQYFDSGRCSQLTGVGGAYNLYEDEKFKKTVISKLDEIISRLDQIQRTQSELYRVLSDCQYKISKLTSATQEMALDVQSIKQSSEIIEYNTTYMKQNDQMRVWLNGF